MSAPWVQEPDRESYRLDLAWARAEGWDLDLWDECPEDELGDLIYQPDAPDSPWYRSGGGQGGILYAEIQVDCGVQLTAIHETTHEEMDFEVPS